MTLIVETGAGDAGAESYASIDEAAAYWTARQHDPMAAAWENAESDDLREGALREASTYLDATYGGLYLGSRSTTTQGLLWPRVNRTLLNPADYTVYADFVAAQAALDTVITGADGLELASLPVQIVNAAIELAVRALSGPLAPDIDPATPWIKREKVGPLETEYGGAGPAVLGGSYGFVDTMLAPVLNGARNGSWNWA